MPTHVTNYESDLGIPCHDHIGEYRWTDSRAIWAAEIWTPHVRLSERRPAKTAQTVSTGATDHKTWIVVVGAARRHVLCSKGEKMVVVLLRSCSGCDGVDGPAQVDVVRRCEHCSDHV